MISTRACLYSLLFLRRYEVCLFSEEIFSAARVPQPCRKLTLVVEMVEEWVQVLILKVVVVEMVMLMVVRVEM